MSEILGYKLEKALVRDVSNPNLLHDMTGMVSKSPLIPTFLTGALAVSDHFLSTDTFEHDRRSTTVSQLGDSAYHDRGNYVGKESSTTHLFKVPHIAIQGRVRPRDVLRTRMPGTADVLDSTDRQIAEELASMRRAYAAYNELALARTITTGGLYVPNGTVSAVDFYTEYLGTSAASRPSVNFDLDNSAIYPREKGEEARIKLLNALNDGDMVTGFIAICGKTFFQKRISHAKEEQAYVDRANMGQNPLAERLRNFNNQYRMYVGSDDIVYVQYTANIGGSQLIGDNDCYILPVGVNDVISRAYAPAETMQYVNTVAQREYAWRYDDEFQGTKLFMESNSGFYLTKPDLIVKGTVSA